LREYAKAVLKFAKLNTQAQQRGAVVHGRSLPPYRLRYNKEFWLFRGVTLVWYFFDLGCLFIYQILF
jgi:hypothetical protein